MKKAILGILTAAMVFTAGTMNVSAHCGSGHHRTDCRSAAGFCYYVDEDGDGICDSCNTYHDCSRTGNDRGCRRSAVRSSNSCRTGESSHHRHGCRR